jgi:multiple sugar transport system permease protein
MEGIPTQSTRRAPSRFFRFFTGDRGLALALLLPSLLLVAALVLVPLIYTLILSFQSATVNVIGGRGQLVGHWVGLRNYIHLLTNSYFLSGLRATLYFFAASILIELTIGILMAHLLNLEFRGRTLVRALVFIPWAIPTIVNATLWGMIFNGNAYGALNGLLPRLGLGNGHTVWLDTTPVWPHVPLLGPFFQWIGMSRGMNALIIGDEWKTLPIVAFLVLAGLQTIPKDYYEAATIDGATPWQRFRYITLPLLGPILSIVLILRTMQLVRAFTIFYTLEATNIPVLSISAYQQAFSFGYFGRGSAVAFIIGLISLFFAWIYIRWLYREEVA